MTLEIVVPRLPEIPPEFLFWGLIMFMAFAGILLIFTGLCDFGIENFTARNILFLACSGNGPLTFGTVLLALAIIAILIRYNLVSIAWE